MGKARILFKQALKSKNLQEYLDSLKKIEEIFKTGMEKDMREAEEVLKEPELFKKGQELQKKVKEEKIAPSFYISSMPREIPSSKTAVLASLKIYEDVYKKEKDSPNAKVIKERIEELKKKLEEIR